MSNSLIPVRLPFFAVRVLIGCRDEGLLARHAKNLRKVLDQIDEDLQDHDDSPVDTEYIDHLKTLKPTDDPELDKLEAKVTSFKDRLTKGKLVEAELDALMIDIESFMSDSTKALQKENQTSSQGDSVEEQNVAPLPDARIVLRHLFFQEPLDARVGFAYDAVTQALCRSFGTKLPNQDWIDIKRISDWLGRIDKVLAAKGISRDLFSVEMHLLSRGNPFIETYSTDVPYVGYLLNEEIQKILPSLESLKLKAGGPEDPQTYLVDIRKWLKTCAKEGEDLICFTV